MIGLRLCDPAVATIRQPETTAANVEAASRPPNAWVVSCDLHHTLNWHIPDFDILSHLPVRLPMSLVPQLTAFALAVFAGAAGTCAAGIDGTLSDIALGGIGMYAVLVDFIVAAVLASLAVLVNTICCSRMPPSPSGTVRPVLPCCAKPWHYAAGFCGATLVACNVLGTRLAGLVVVFGAFIASQLVTAAIIDQRCSVSQPQAKITRWKAIGLVVTVAGAAIGTMGPLLQPAEGATQRDNGAVALGASLGLVGGVALSVQTMLNTLLAARLRSVSRTTMISLWVGLLATIAVCIVVTLTIPGGASAAFGSLTPSQSPPWLWIGGVGSVIVVASGSIVPPVIGVAGFSVALIAGQLLMSIVLDATGMFGGTGSVSPWAIASTITVFVGAAIVQLPNPCSKSDSATAAVSLEARPEGLIQKGGSIRALSSSPAHDSEPGLELVTV